MSVVETEVKVCSRDGCNEPRAVSSSGKVLTYCREHQREYWKNWNAKQPGDKGNQKRGPKPKPPEPRPLTEAQMVSSVFKLCIIDYNQDTMTFVEGKVTRRCKTDALKLLPGGWEILLAKHQEDGYLIVERGTPPVQPGITASYDWRD